MKNVFNYMFKREFFISKISFLYLLIFMVVFTANLANTYNPYTFGTSSPLFYILLAVAGILLILPFGYFISCIKNQINKNDVFPNFELKKLFILGSKFLLSALIYVTIVHIIFLILQNLSNFFISNNLSTLSFLISVLYFLMTFIIYFLLTACIYNFAKTDSIFAFVKFKEVIRLINKSVGKYFKYFILSIVIVFIIFFISNISMSLLIFLQYLGLTIYSVIMSLILTYALLVYSKIITNSIEE